MDFYATVENAQCPLFFSLHDQGAPLGIDVWPRTLLYAFPLVTLKLTLIPPNLARVREEGLSIILLAGETLASLYFSTPVLPTMATASLQGPAVSGSRENIPPTPGWLSGMGL